LVENEVVPNELKAPKVPAAQVCVLTATNPLEVMNPAVYPDGRGPNRTVSQLV
jgi:hypothetical protein